MLKLVVLVTVVLTLCFLLQASEAKRAGEGFCYKKLNSKTGECKSKMKGKFQKVDCCSNGGEAGGWSAKRKDRMQCEPCKTTVVETSYWGAWSEWSNCSAICGPSFKVRTRECISTGSKSCKGRKEKSKNCVTDPCPIDGGWSPWGNWTSCSVTCGNGTQTRTRNCNNPEPQFGGKDCQGKIEDSQPCRDREHCPIHGGWGEWSSHWSECSETCGLGIRTRERKCDNPKPKYGGKPCDEKERQDVKYCRERRCEPEYSASGSGEGWESGSGSASGSSGDSGDWEEYSASGKRAWSDDEDL